MKNLLLCLFFIGGISFQPMPKLTPMTISNYTVQGTSVIQVNSSWNKVNQYKWNTIQGVKYFEMSLDEFPDMKSKYQISSLPVLLVFKNGKMTKKIEGGVAFKITLPQTEIIK